MSAKIFINYRKDDSPWNSIALYQELIKHFPKNNIFKDFNTIKPGRDFVESIESALESCDVLLVLISEKWIAITNEKGLRRLDEENDFVRLEIATALKRNIIVIPVIFDGASMPRADNLPEDLKKLARRQFVEIDKNRFESDTLSLVKAIKEELPDKPDPHIVITDERKSEERGPKDENIKKTIAEDVHSGKSSLKYWLIGIGSIALIYILFNYMSDQNYDHRNIGTKTIADSSAIAVPVEPVKANDQLGIIHITLYASGLTVRTGDPTEITVIAYDENKYPLPDADVHLQARGGYFENESTLIIGQTDQNGMFRIRLRVFSPGGTSFPVIASVSAKGRNTEQEEIMIHVIQDARADSTVKK